MSALTQEYEKITEERGKIIERLKSLEKLLIIRQYNEFTEKNRQLYQRQNDLYGKVKQEEFASCNHILVYTQIDYDRYEGRTYKSRGCIKCGLDDSVLDCEEDLLLPSRRIMYDYFKGDGHNRYLKGMETGVVCDIDLAQAIYFKIRENHPDIDDETAVIYLKKALEDIRNIKVNDERKASRARRLSLPSKFSNWNSRDVYN